MSVTFQLSPGVKVAPVIASFVFDQLLTPSTPLTIVKFLGLGRHTPYLLVALQKLHWDVLVRALELPCNRHKGGHARNTSQFCSLLQKTSLAGD
jgi:hypothetical protein